MKRTNIAELDTRLPQLTLNERTYLWSFLGANYTKKELILKHSNHAKA